MATAPVKPALPEYFYPANVLTELRLVAIPLILAAVVLRRPGWALGIFVGAAISDGFDGWVARRFNQRSFTFTDKRESFRHAVPVNTN